MELPKIFSTAISIIPFSVKFLDESINIAFGFGALVPNPRVSGKACLQSRLLFPQQRLLGHHDIAQGAGHEQPDSGLERVAKAHGFSLHAGVSCEAHQKALSTYSVSLALPRRPDPVNQLKQQRFSMNLLAIYVCQKYRLGLTDLN